jgi:putative SOS response-associated peptidase YedK
LGVRGLIRPGNLQAHYNIAPTTMLDVVIPRAGERLEIVPMPRAQGKASRRLSALHCRKRRGRRISLAALGSQALRLRRLRERPPWWWQRHFDNLHGTDEIIERFMSEATIR